MNGTSLREENVDLPGCNTFSVMPADLKSTPSNPAKKKDFFFSHISHRTKFMSYINSNFI